jgi:hypothetical protein
MRLFDSQAHLSLIIALSGCTNIEKSRPGTGKSVLARVNEEIASVETRNSKAKNCGWARERKHHIYIFYFLRARRAKSKRSRRPCGSRAPAAGLRCVCSASDKYTHTHTNQLARAHTQGKMKVKPGVSRKGLYRQLFNKTRPHPHKTKSNRVRKCDDLWWSKCARCSWEKVFALEHFLKLHPVKLSPKTICSQTNLIPAWSISPQKDSFFFSKTKDKINQIHWYYVLIAKCKDLTQKRTIWTV